jgi:hypothetical protein
VKNHIFLRTDVFKYLGVLVTIDNIVTKDFQARFKAGNGCYYSLLAVWKSRRLQIGCCDGARLPP